MPKAPTHAAHGLKDVYASAMAAMQAGEAAKALEIFGRKPMPTWGSDLTGIDFDSIKYFVRSTEKQASSWEELPEDIRSYCSATKQCFDAEKLTTSLQVRSRKAGDHMIPLGMTHACKIQDIMVDLHIPAFQRDSVPLVIAGETILWIAGYRRSSLAPVDASTTRVIEMELLPQR